MFFFQFLQVSPIALKWLFKEGLAVRISENRQSWTPVSLPEAFASPSMPSDISEISQVWQPLVSRIKDLGGVVLKVDLR